MGFYENHKIIRLGKQLNAATIDKTVTDRIMEGSQEAIASDMPGETADWLKNAMCRMDDLLDADTRKAVREGCACCLGGKREKMSKAIAKVHATLEDRIKAANETHFVFGHSVTLQENGEIIVSFYPAGQEHYQCACLPKADTTFSITYCQCCGGHVKHHLQHALDSKLDCNVLTSALASGGREPCTFSLRKAEG